MTQRLKCAACAAFVGITLIVATSAVRAASIAGVELARHVQTRGPVLELASCGVRGTLWMEHYVAALYVPRGEAAHALQDRDQAKAVVMHVVNDRFMPPRIPRKWRRPLARTLDPEKFSRVQRAFRALSRGDRVMAVYLPRDGLSMYVNDQIVARGASHAVIEAILEAWRENDTIRGKLDRLASEHPCG